MLAAIIGGVFLLISGTLLVMYCCLYKRSSAVHDQESVMHMSFSKVEQFHEKGSTFFSEVAGSSCSICLFD